MSMPDEIVVEDEDVLRAFRDLQTAQKAMHYWTGLYLEQRGTVWRTVEKKLSIPEEAGYVYFHDTHTLKKNKIVKELKSKEKEASKE